VIGGGTWVDRSRRELARSGTLRDDIHHSLNRV
jgi:hypothetical protein